MTALRILYVEDNDDLREAMAYLLRADDREIIECGSGEEALAAFESSRFDLVVTDISLPGMSGTELARTILKTHPLQWIALCSGYDPAGWATELGRNVSSLPKPFDMDVVEKLIAEIRRQRDAR